MLAVAASALLGCETNDTAPELINVVDVAPREVEAGDRLEVLGTNLPTGEAKEATITLRGTLRRPGQPPIEGQTIVIDGARLSTDKVSLPVTDSLVSRFCGQGDDATHTTFHGDVRVELSTPAAGGLPVTGSIKGVTLDVQPPSPRRAVVDAREREGQKVLDFMGIGVTPDAPTAGGLVVASVRPESPAARAQIQPGDVIVSFEGVKVTSLGDMLPSGEERSPDIGVKRGADEPVARPIALEGFHASTSTDLLGAGIVLGVAAALLLLFLSPAAGLLSWAERRVAARMASRARAPRAGMRALLSRLVAHVRASVAADVGPKDSDPLTVRLAPYLVFLGISATFAVMPFGQYLIGADLDAGVPFLITLTALSLIAVTTGGWAAGERWSIGRGLRAAGQVLAYELPAAVAIACIVMLTGSLRLADIVSAQGGVTGAPLDAGGWPWHWFVFRNPVTFGLFLLYFTATIAAEGPSATPLSEAEIEAPASFREAPSGTRSLLFLFAEWAHVFVMCGLASALFLGGWQIPGVPAAMQTEHRALQLAGALVFLLKSWGLLFLVLWIRFVLPRLRVDQRTRLSWRVFMPLSLVALGLSAAWSMGAAAVGLGRSVGLASGVVTFVTWSSTVFHFIRRVQIDLRESRVPLNLHPYL